MFEANSQNQLLSPSQNPLEPPLQHSPEPPTGSLLTRVKLNCKARWPARAQAIGAAPATQEVGAVATSRSNSAAA